MSVVIKRQLLLNGPVVCYRCLDRVWWWAWRVEGGHRWYCAACIAWARRGGPSS